MTHNNLDRLPIKHKFNNSQL